MLNSRRKRERREAKRDLEKEEIRLQELRAVKELRVAKNSCGWQKKSHASGSAERKLGRLSNCEEDRGKFQGRAGIRNPRTTSFIDKLVSSDDSEWGSMSVYPAALREDSHRYLSHSWRHARRHMVDKRLNVAQSHFPAPFLQQLCAKLHTYRPKSGSIR